MKYKTTQGHILMNTDEIWFETPHKLEVSNKGRVRNSKTGKLLNGGTLRLGDKFIATKKFVKKYFIDSGKLQYLDPLFLLHGNCKSFIVKTPTGRITRVFNLKSFCREERIVYNTVITNIHRGKIRVNDYVFVEMI